MIGVMERSLRHEEFFTIIAGGWLSLPGLEFSLKWVGGQPGPQFSKSRGPTQKVGAMQQMHV